MKKISRTKKATYELHRIIDSLSFPKIFFIWIIITILFGCVYLFFAGSVSYLQITQTGEAVNSFPQAIYFSFITATTTGFGDITPIGIFKVISIVEVILGLLMIAVVTSKLISIKQNVIIDELYELTFSERINRIRSSLLYSRQNLNALIHKIEDGIIKKREIKGLFHNFISFQETIEEIILVLQKRSGKGEFIKSIDDVHAGIIASSILYSLHRVEEAVIIMKLNYIEWQTDKNIHYLEKIILHVEEVFDEIEKIKVLPKDVFDNLSEEKKILIDKIKEEEPLIK